MKDESEDVRLAIEVLSDAMKNDEDLAWGWQCNVAVAMMDEGCEHERANRGAARFMMNAFGVDVMKHEQWKMFERNWQ